MSLEFRSLVNPDYVNVSSAMEIVIRDVDGQSIMTLSEAQGVTFTPIVGGISGIEMIANDETTINHDSSVTLNFAPLHNLPEDAMIVITVPSDYFVMNCNIESFSGFDSDGPTCIYSSSTNSITLTSMFDAPEEGNGDYSYIYTEGEVLSITFTSLTMPDSAVGVENV